jgi:hypothetical protein
MLRRNELVSVAKEIIREGAGVPHAMAERIATKVVEAILRLQQSPKEGMSIDHWKQDEA